MIKINTKNNFITKIKKLFFPFYKLKELKEIFKILEKNQPKNKQVAMFVGGCVRKHILNEKIDDIDIATIFTPNQIKEKFKNTKVKVIDTGIHHGTVTLVLKNTKVELTTLRKDIKTDGRHAEVVYTEDWNKDSQRRDFTINSIYLDKKGNLFDPQLGLTDLKKRIVKFIGDPNERIEEDYLRIIRYIRFSLQYKFEENKKTTLEAIKLNVNGIKNISKERMFNELTKILKLENFSYILQFTELKKIFSIIFPEFKYLDRLEKFKLFKEHKIDLFIEKDLLLSILLIDDSNNHEYFCHKYKISNLIKQKLNIITRAFLEYKLDRNYLGKNLSKNIYLLGKNEIKNVIIFIFFFNNDIKIKEFEELIKKIKKIKIPKFPLDGDYLIEKGFSEGKKIGATLKALEKEWLNNSYQLTDQNISAIIEKFDN